MKGQICNETAETPINENEGEQRKKREREKERKREKEKEKDMPTKRKREKEKEKDMPTKKKRESQPACYKRMSKPITDHRSQRKREKRKGDVHRIRKGGRSLEDDGKKRSLLHLQANVKTDHRRKEKGEERKEKKREKEEKCAKKTQQTETETGKGKRANPRKKITEITDHR